MTSDEGKLSWWRILWATEGVQFGYGQGAASHTYDKPKRWSNLDNRNPNIGGILHQNSCGHGYTPDDATHSTVSVVRDFSAPERLIFYSKNNMRSMMGATPSERSHRFAGKKKRWGST